MEVIDLKERSDLVGQYVELRNSYSDLLLTSPVNAGDTMEWLNKADIEIKGLIEDNILSGVVILYLDRGGEIAFFARERNRGTGSRLLSIIQETATEKGLKSVWAWVLEDNLTAQRAFEKNGFKREGTTERDYRGALRKGARFVKNLAG